MTTTATPTTPAPSPNAERYCARHPKVPTALSCSRCLTPICPECAVSGAVGFLCPKCGGRALNPLYSVRPERFVLAAVAGTGSGVLAGVLLQAISAFFIWGILFLAPMIGGFLGEVVLRATGRKRGPAIETLTGASVVVGSGLSLLVTGMAQMFANPLHLALFLLSVALTAGAAVGKIRSL